jgi:molybdopterin/thiamine biosynthesis adenylyltransferase/rhodanese-related sulfurtransferase
MAVSFQRYEGHLNLPGMGLLGQDKLNQASVLCIGVGGLGCPISIYLAAAGVGRIGLVDSDSIEETNLLRQVIFTPESLGRKKATFAKEYLTRLNPNITITDYPIRLTPDWVDRLFPQYDLVIDASDNFETRLLINLGGIRFGKPIVFGSVFRYEGQVAVFNARGGPCYECLYRGGEIQGTEVDSGCNASGVLSTLTGMVGLFQANEVIKLLVGIGETLAGKLLLVDALGTGTRTLSLAKDPKCLACGSAKNEEVVPNGGGRVQDLPHEGATINSLELWNLINSNQKLIIYDVRSVEEYDGFQIPRSKRILLGELPEKSRLLGNTADQQVIFYCKSDFRSQMAVELLATRGIKARYLQGGLGAWSGAGLVLEQDD